MRVCTATVSIAAPAPSVLDAFFEPAALASWWDVTRSLCLPRPLGSYALQWAPTEWRDDVLGRLGGTLNGTVMEFRAGQEFFVAELYWHPPDGDPLGPMALEVSCLIDGTATVLTVRQSGHDERNPRWERYYQLLASNWGPALKSLKTYLETRSAPSGG